MAQASPPEVARPKGTFPGAGGMSALVIAATVVAYLPSLSGALIWNDSDYVTTPALRSWAGLGRIWTQVGATQQYYPLLHSAFWVQHRLWGDHPLGYHLATLLLHAAAAVLFALVLRRLFRDRLAPAFAGAEWLAALLFALHPVHVESVAWISEQKNTLSLVFYLLAALVYLRFDASRRPRDYAGALALFILSLLCKTVTATLPAALLVALWWRRGRLEGRRDLAPLLPWLALGAAAGRFSSWVERAYGGAQGPDFDLAPLGRLLVAGRATCFYLAHLLWPAGLDFIYPRWVIDPSAGWQWLFPVGVLALVLLLWSWRRRNRAPLAALLFFIGSLFPVLGFVNLYGARYAWVWDHWQYLADLGPLALLAAGLVAGWRRAAARWTTLRFPGLGAGAGAALALVLGALTWAHGGMFHDDPTLYAENLRLNPGSWLAHDNLGCELEVTPGRLNDAVAEYREALRLKPDFPEAHNNLGNADAKLPGRLDEAIAEYRESLRLKPDFADAAYNLGNALNQAGRPADAVPAYESALRIRPDFVLARYNLANTLSALGRGDEAVAQLEAVLRIQPGLAAAHNNLGLLLSRLPGRGDDAVAQYREALRLDPGSAESHANLGLALAAQPARMTEALEQDREALRLRPDYADAHFYLANALVQTGQVDPAVEEYQQALRIRPRFAEADNNLGMVLCRTGHLEAGLAHIEAALRADPRFAPAYFTRAAALMQLGRRPEAVADLEQLLALRPGDASALRLLDLIRSQP